MKDCISQLLCVLHFRKSEDESIFYGGWARMAQPIVNFAVVEVAKPNIGEKRPSRVRADVTVNLSVRNEIKAEWENLRKHDVCFLITVRPTSSIGTKFDHRAPFVPQVGLTFVRGCEIEGMLDQNGRVIEEGPEPKPALPGEKRTFRVWLDCNQYRLDMDNANQGKERLFDCRMPNEIETMDFNDTFLDLDHLRASFPEHAIKVKTDDPRKLVPPFRLTFEEVASKKRDKDSEVSKDVKKCITVEPHIIPSRGPYLFNEPKKNAIPFTPTQVEAIRAGMQPGLTLVVGPPGTGKTDVAVQIISNLYHNFPTQRTLIVTHSNQALNQLFEKIMALDIDERHLLRLGHGEEALETEKDFSRYGRVNYVLAKRLDLLTEVQRLQESLDVTGDVAYTCETAGHFFLYQVLARWERFISRVRPASGKIVAVKTVKDEFPFHCFFDNAPKPLFKSRTYEEDMEIAEGCFRYIEKIFTQLEEFRAFELLRSGLDRSKYLLVKEAKVIAMTCTHAALKRRELVDLGFKYDNILMEESAQILEIETFIPLLLQNPQDGYSRLKRWIMIGDHHQLPPVIKNMAFQKYSNMEQSLFTRIVRLGVPTVDLDGQGRARPRKETLTSNVNNTRVSQPEDTLNIVLANQEPIEKQPSNDTPLTSHTNFYQQCSKNHIQTPPTDICNILVHPQSSSEQRFLPSQQTEMHQSSPPFNKCNTPCKATMTSYNATGTLKQRMNGHRFDTNHNNLDKQEHFMHKHIIHILTLVVVIELYKPSPVVASSPVEYRVANAGFWYDFQLINVEDFNNVGESEPSPYFYQNLAEAEYCVAVFMYMRLLGYPAEKISILTTYNGQKHLIRDVINIRCASNPLIGRPHKVLGGHDQFS
uniref:Intron-binding protein aquarius n=2 Tax=Timema TaxID=61471 RepID=A0A7R8VRG6_TIMDO|nr:unnamed protein product [Timema douglasi]